MEWDPVPAASVWKKKKNSAVRGQYPFAFMPELDFWTIADGRTLKTELKGGKGSFLILHCFCRGNRLILSGITSIVHYWRLSYIAEIRKTLCMKLALWGFVDCLLPLMFTLSSLCQLWVRVGGNKLSKDKNKATIFPRHTVSCRPLGKAAYIFPNHLLTRLRK